MSEPVPFRLPFPWCPVCCLIRCERCGRAGCPVYAPSRDSAGRIASNVTTPTPWPKLDYDAIDLSKAPWDGDEVLVYVACADTDIVRLASWDDGEFWEDPGYASRDELRGWWSYDSSLTREKLEGRCTPTHWLPGPYSFPRSRP